MVKPITPDEIALSKQKIFPEFVVESFNYCITEAYLNGSARVLQSDVVNMIKTHLKEGERVDYDWLSIEEIYSEAGWKVEYDKPSYDENFSAYFKFTKKRS